MFRLWVSVFWALQAGDETAGHFGCIEETGYMFQLLRSR